MKKFVALTALMFLGWVGIANSAPFGSLTLDNGVYDASANKITAEFTYAIDGDFAAIRDYTLSYSYDTDFSLISPPSGSGSIALGMTSIEDMANQAATLFSAGASGFPIGAGNIVVPAWVMNLLIGASGTQTTLSAAYSLSATFAPDYLSGYGVIELTNILFSAGSYVETPVNDVLTSNLAFSGSAELTAPVPLPMTAPLLVGGLGMLAAMSRRRRKAS